MNIIIEVPLKDRAELEKLQELYPDSIELIESKRLIGSEEMIQALIGITLVFGPTIVNFLVNRKKENKPTVIKINGVEIEYNSKEELETILKSYIESNKEKSSSFLETVNLEAKGDVTISVKQKKSKAQIGKIKSTEGKIEIDIEQED